MSRTRVLYHMVRADFLERIRRYSYLLSLGFAIYLGYVVYSGQVRLQLDHYQGVANSAWRGALISLTTSVFLSLIGFYVVKNSIQRDRETRVGRILAATPMSKPFYTLSKALSNFAVLATMVGVMALAALAMQISQPDHPHIDVVNLLAPVLVFGLTTVAFTAALSVLFETIPVLRGGTGNILYFFLWTFLLAIGTAGMAGRPANSPMRYFGDYTGISSIVGQMQQQVRQLDPFYSGGSSFSIGDITRATNTFLWNGIHWNSSILLSRLLWLALAAALTLLAAIFFDRFEPAHELSLLKKFRKSAPALESAAALPQLHQSHASITRLTPLTAGRRQNRFPALVLAELRLIARGQRWWWYGVAAGLFFACIASPVTSARSGIILAAWLWPTLLWSQMGTREARFSTRALIFSAPRAFPRQLLATWISGIVVALATGGGLGLHLLIARDFAALGTWFTAALFIPALALALGVFTESRKPFEALYVAWWYTGPLHHLPHLDFMGTTPASSTPLIYLTAAAVLVLAACAWRKLRLRLA